ncbi:MAG: SDR family NAD(P)-dependent oxidoreductase [Chloroflexi bacterium]|uniref:SDR family NAD(P)-dependent oxidoreductase n=1 Tax=Candidatus Chlorohelix allophototropha TaxID=3003348 RepID=A0A8T7M1F2_9CHLR|nr:SDR family NAD(P)-dependent oxidoreductase [Chloroflexota bacterium]WJW67695.1 SDR family NAD(P)-dependent oxidoreductase [Chloroflexota bacterium L227-S17]
MQNFAGKVAVITGAASGIGKGLAEKCVREGMRVVLADFEEQALQQTVTELRAFGEQAILPVIINVAKEDQVLDLASQTIAEFGAVDFLFNNAGVGVNKPIWEFTHADWEWVLSVNLWGVINGIHAFLPLMLKQEQGGHIINTSSVSGLTSAPYMAPYNITKHGIVTLSETLYIDLQVAGYKHIKVSVLCPGFVNTRAYDAERNRPAEWQNPSREIAPEEVQRYEMGRKALEGGMAPSEVADKTFAAIKDEKFYILTHPHFNPVIQMRMEDILLGRNPMSARPQGRPSN